MTELEQSLAWTNLPVPDVLPQLSTSQQQQIISWAENIVSSKTEGLDELYTAISMIVRYIPNFVVIPLMVEHIKPQIAAGVCIKLGVEQATGYANDLPKEYFDKVSKHLDAELMARILENMKKHLAERFIESELKANLPRMLDIARHLNRRMLEVVAKHFTPPQEKSMPSTIHQSLIEQIVALQ
ncbi:MAG: hypothetical protein WCH05_02860 [Chlorobiaceae bacterium]